MGKIPLKVKAMSNNSSQKVLTGYFFSIVLIILGGVCSIVGLCLTIEWMIGVGIAIICISSVIAYNSIPQEKNRCRHHKRVHRSAR